jgi:hypothetical protein
MSRLRAVILLLSLALCGALGFLGSAGPALAEEAATWRLEQPKSPPSPTGVEGAPAPIGLGHVGDIEFEAPNRGLLITSGNPPTIPAGVWEYNGAEWHELAEVCGATDGRIAWAGPEEFWTVSDGRPGQVEGTTGELPPLEDNTLCRFAPPHPGSPLEVVASYAHPAFEVDSYQAMHAAGCIGPADCWFGGDPLPEPLIGAFQLHWNGSSLEAEPYPAEGHAIEGMFPFEGRLYESVRISPEDRVSEEQLETPVLHRINPKGVLPRFQPERGLPLDEGEGANPIDFLRLSGAEGALWAAAGEGPEGGGQVTVIRHAGGNWSQVLGPETHPTGADTFPGMVVSSIAAEPGTNSVWLALDTHSDARQPSPTATADVARVSAEGKLIEEQTLPSSAEIEAGVDPKGAAAKIACPAAGDCWLVTTQGWLFHLTTAAARASEVADPDTDPSFGGPLITNRPKDQGLPQVPPDAPPPDDSGLIEEAPNYGGAFAESKAPTIDSSIQAPLLTDLHSRVIHGTTLELRFHLAVKARVRLLAKRHKKLVASTPMHTLAAGNRKLLLVLNRKEWPTKLSLQTHPLAPLPTTTTKEAVGGPEHGGSGSNSISTGLTVLPRAPTFAELDQRP